MKINHEAQAQIKKNLGKKAAEFIKNDMVVGLGTGSTAACFIQSLSERCKQGLKITAVSSSKKSEELARSLGIPVLDLNDISWIDITVDGADEVDPQHRMIKGGGGAHVREKIVASSSNEMIVIIDETKLVNQLGAFGLPVEILPFGYSLTIKKIERKGYKGDLRMNKENQFFLTDNGNFLFDIRTPSLFTNPEQTHLELVQIPGVLDTGFFFDLASKVLVGYADGKVLFH